MKFFLTNLVNQMLSISYNHNLYNRIQCLKNFKTLKILINNSRDKVQNKTKIENKTNQNV